MTCFRTTQLMAKMELQHNAMRSSSKTKYSNIALTRLINAHITKALGHLHV